VAWRDDDLDLALVEVVDDVWRAPASGSVRWGRVLGSDPQECLAVGFPKAQERPGNERAVRDSEQLMGWVLPLGAIKSRRMVLSVEGSSPLDRERWGACRARQCSSARCWWA
jgi:hypothetical protein